MNLKVTIWNENRHEQVNPEVQAIYPQGIHGAIAKGLLANDNKLVIKTATFDEPEHGLSKEVLDNTDVLIWWGHILNSKVSDEVVEHAYRRVQDGMGLIVLHSAAGCKLFKKLMGTSCKFKWREADDTERLWNVFPGHPITAGIGEYIELPEEEMYGEAFDIPAPDELVFISWFTGGEVMRSGCVYYRGKGRIFYFRPGHETFPTYWNKQIIQVLSNAVQWAGKLER